jgi:hypothetical protein
MAEKPFGLVALVTRFPGGRGFAGAVAQMAQELGAKLRLDADVLNGSVDSLQHVDKAARGLGGSNILDDPAVLLPIVAYAGEVMREATGGHWDIRVFDINEPGQGIIHVIGPQLEEMNRDRWEPIIVDAIGREYYPLKILKPLLEHGSVWARVEVELGEFGSLVQRARRRQDVQGPR